MYRIFISIVTSIFQGFAAAFVISKQVSLNEKIKLKSKIMLFLCSFLFGIISFYFLPNETRLFVSIIYVSIEICMVLNIRNVEAILYAIMTEILYIIAEIIGSIFMIVLGYKSDKIVENLNSMLVLNVVIAVILIAISSFAPIKKISRNIILKYRKNKKVFNNILLIASAFFLLAYKNGFEFLLRSNYYLNILFMILIIAIVLLIFKNEYKAEKLKEENIQMLNYVTKYEKIITEQGKANHEFKNQLMVIKGYSEISKEKMLEYINSITEDVKKTSSSYLISQLNNFPDGGIKGLLYYKLSMMEDYKIKYSLSVEKSVKTKLNKLDTLNIKNITKVLGILLDNAIDASKISNKKEIIIVAESNKDEVIFEISNTYKGNINIEKIGTGYSSKGKGHGYGLRLLKDIISENSIYEVKTELIDKYYVTRFMIKIKQNKKGKK